MTAGRRGIIIEEGAFLKRDAGECAYVTNSASVSLTDDWFAEKRGALTYISPSDKQILECGYSPDELAASLAGLPKILISISARRIFCECLKLLEAPRAESIDILERKIRQAAAIALREGGGGGLYQCALVLSEIKRRQNR